MNFYTQAEIIGSGSFPNFTFTPEGLCTTEEGTKGLLNYVAWGVTGSKPKFKGNTAMAGNYIVRLKTTGGQRWEEWRLCIKSRSQGELQLVWTGDKEDAESILVNFIRDMPGKLYKFFGGANAFGGQKAEITNITGTAGAV